MTHEEMIAVIQAHRDNKAIQFRGKIIPSEGWIDCDKTVYTIQFNFQDYEYRVKPEEPYYRPFKSAEEVLKAINEHGLYVMDNRTKGQGYTVVNEFSDKYVFIDMPYTKALDRLTFADGTPFGVKEE